MNMYLYTWKPSRSTWKCCFPSPAPCSSVCEHQVFLTDADITRYFPTHPWWRIWAFPVTKLSKNPTDNHTGKLRVLTMLTINTLILEPKASMLFTESLLAIFKHLSNWGGGKQFFPFPSPKRSQDCCFQPHSWFLLAVSAQTRARACVSWQMDLNLPAPACEDAVPLHMLRLGAPHSHQQRFARVNIN